MKVHLFVWNTGGDYGFKKNIKDRWHKNVSASPQNTVRNKELHSRNTICLYDFLCYLIVTLIAISGFGKAKMKQWLMLDK